MIVQSILGHKVAAAALALALGGTSAVAATGNLPTALDDPVELTDDSAEEMDDKTKEPDEIESATDDDIEVEIAGNGEDDKDEVLPPADNDGVEYGDVACDDAKNHGEYVSGVAQDDTIEGNRGAIVSQAAKTDCGKRDKQEKTKEDKAERKASSDNGNSGKTDKADKGNGQGKKK